MDVSKMNVLIVEDEAAVRRGLTKKINWEELNLNIMGEAQNAEEAYEIIKVSLPEIILLDMRMPGMGGMKFLEILKEQFPQIKVIIVSGHSDFEYMRQALQCGASDYLLKPIIKEDLKTALSKVIKCIDEEKQVRNGMMYQSIIINESKNLLKASLLNKLLLGLHLNESDIKRRLAYLNIDIDFNYYVLAVIRIVNFEQVKQTYMNDTSLVFFALENVMNESMKDVKNAFGFKSSLNENEFIYIFGFEEKEAVKERLGKLFTFVVRNVEIYNKLNINVSISDICDNISGISRLYKNTSYIMGKRKEYGSSNVLFSESFFEEEQLNNLLTDPQIQQITLLIEENDKPKLMSAVNSILESVCDVNTENLYTIRATAAKIYFCLEKILENSQTNLNSIFNKIMTYNDLVTKYSEPDDIKNAMIKVVIEFTDLFHKRGKAESTGTIFKAKEYIDNYYYEDISLDFISKKFFLNSAYFCELFKKEVGCSFNKYINNLRIDKAKELLKDLDMKPTDVAELVGFKELGYFCIVFKKATGMTPTEYKQKN